MARSREGLPRAPVISALGDLIAARQIKLVVPQVVLDEFSRNKGRVIEDARRSLQSHFRLVREAVNRFGEEEYRSAALAALNEVDHKIFTGSELVIVSVEKIEKLLTAQLALATTDAIKCSITERALAGLAPYHRAKNSVADAILIEVYADMVKDRKSKTSALPSSLTTARTLASRTGIAGSRTRTFPACSGPRDQLTGVRLCDPRLSMTTTSPGLSSGTRT